MIRSNVNVKVDVDCSGVVGFDVRNDSIVIHIPAPPFNMVRRDHFCYQDMFP